jgi:hypothetical protein
LTNIGLVKTVKDDRFCKLLSHFFLTSILNHTLCILCRFLLICLIDQPQKNTNNKEQYINPKEIAIHFDVIISSSCFLLNLSYFSLYIHSFKTTIHLRMKTFSIFNTLIVIVTQSDSFDVSTVMLLLRLVRQHNHVGITKVGQSKFA